MPWNYDPGEKRYKHKWNKVYAGFSSANGHQVGKCPKQLNHDIAQGLLNTGISWHDPRSQSPDPKYIYNVFEGVVYIAVVTESGKSYHGYPHRGRIPKSVLRRLRERSEANGCRREFDTWLRQHIKS